MSAMSDSAQNGSYWDWFSVIIAPAQIRQCGAPEWAQRDKAAPTPTSFSITARSFNPNAYAGGAGDRI